jgi:aminoglycoside phosphotransferase (APT) family kinase protein
MSEDTPGVLLGAGKEAEVRAYGNLAAKLYNAGASKHRPLREAAIQAFAETVGLPVPAVHEVRQIAGRWAIVMDRVDGVSFAEAMLRDRTALPRYLEQMAVLHQSVHCHEAISLGGLRQRLAANIQAAPGLPVKNRNHLLTRLREMPDGNRLCHGDFHPWNILGDMRNPVVIDWLDTTRGDPLADVCRSYVLMRPSAPELALSYVETYCAMAGGASQDVLRWLPFVAAARLAENVPHEAGALIEMATAGR